MDLGPYMYTIIILLQKIRPYGLYARILSVLRRNELIDKNDFVDTGHD